jgi:peptidoglycan-associated lipoprotein
MRTAKALLIGFVVLSLAAAAGCAKRQLTRGESDRLGAIAAKIAEAERIGAPDCVDPKLLARAKVELEHAQHEMIEHFETAEADVKAAEAAADQLLAKTKACVEARKPAVPPAATPAPPPSPAAQPQAPPVPSESPAAPAPTTAQALAQEEAHFKNIHFDFDKSFIREDARPKLQVVAEHLKKNRDAKVLIEGHCDERGTSEYNMALGERRAASARKYLVGLGVEDGRLSTIGYGKERPLCTEQNEECWQMNRRAVFVLK